MSFFNEMQSDAFTNELKIKTDYFNTIDSTNAEAKRQIRDGLQEDKLFIADAQTAGRGRLGRTFISNEKSGIYMTLALHLPQLDENAVRITAKTAVAVVRAIKQLFPASLSIKWVNDIILNHKKLAGILVETLPDATQQGAYAVIGIGINTGKNPLPEEIQPIATSLFLEESERVALMKAVATEVQKECRALDDLDYLKEYRQYSNVLGKNISFGNLETMEKGLALDIDETGALLVQKEDGTVTRLSTGEISVRL